MSNSIEVTVYLDEFDDEIVKGYAKNTLDMLEDLGDIDTDNLIEELNSRGEFISDISNYSIIDADLVQRFKGGFDKINKRELEEFLNKQGL